MNNPNRRNSATGFFNDFQREYSQFAAFASVDFDILENLTLTLGTRYYDISNEMKGANMGSFYCKVYGTGESGPCTGALYGYGDELAPYGTNLNEQPDNNNSERWFPQPRQPDLAHHGRRDVSTAPGRKATAPAASTAARAAACATRPMASSSGACRRPTSPTT